MIAATVMIARLGNPRIGTAIQQMLRPPVLPHRARIATTGMTVRPVATHPTEAVTAPSRRRHDPVPHVPNVATVTTAQLDVTVMIALLSETKRLVRRGHLATTPVEPNPAAPVRPAVADLTMPRTAIAMKRLAPSPRLSKHPLGSRPSRC